MKNSVNFIIFVLLFFILLILFDFRWFVLLTLFSDRKMSDTQQSHWMNQFKRKQKNNISVSPTAQTFSYLYRLNWLKKQTFDYDYGIWTVNCICNPQKSFEIFFFFYFFWEVLGISSFFGLSKLWFCSNYWILLQRTALNCVDHLLS